MTLSCDCDDMLEWFWLDHTALNEHNTAHWKRARRCVECGKKISKGDKGGVFYILRESTEFEYDRFGWEHTKAADRHACDECYDLILAVIEPMEGFGYCYTMPAKAGEGTLREDVKELAKHEHG